ncbi:MAG: glycogen debranching enzyme family protein, partial [Armatimonadetes bacterium]|nr:glycogen debranching enzyme family protein [Armatimonadota bacterium]
EKVYASLEEALKKEWLVANNSGGYSSSTIINTNTRTYHGLLIAKIKEGRFLYLSKIDEEIEIGEKTYHLGTNQYQNNTIYPQGYQYLKEFYLEDGIPTFIYSAGQFILEKKIWMEYLNNTTYIRYLLHPPNLPLNLKLVPLITFRSHHDVFRGSPDLHFETSIIKGGLKIKPHIDIPPLIITSMPDANFYPTGIWYWNFTYFQEQERGLNFKEDLYSPGIFYLTLEPGNPLTITASLEETKINSSEAHEDEIRRKKEIIGKNHFYFENFPEKNLINQLFLSGNQFIIKDLEKQKVSIIAGYPWFYEWGRDTFISLPGLTLATGHFNEAKNIFIYFLKFLKQGLIPNIILENEKIIIHNSADASLWLFWALDYYLKFTKDYLFLESIYTELIKIIEWYVKGTYFNIKLDPKDGLLYCGEQGIQLTWMDAKIEDWVVTPRTGKPVEVNALWYNALNFMENWSTILNKKNKNFSYLELIDLIKKNFILSFWHEKGQYLYDVIDTEAENDFSLRPNQIFAISLPYSLLPLELEKKIIHIIEEKLLTPFGLRTLSPDDPKYIGKYEGGVNNRDLAYHQGTVWAWLIGAFCEAHYKIYKDKEKIIEILKPILNHLKEEGAIGSISEIFDGDYPHCLRGCISQAWSVAEILRIFHLISSN